MRSVSRTNLASESDRIQPKKVSPFVKNLSSQKINSTFMPEVEKTKLICEEYFSASITEITQSINNAEQDIYELKL